MTDVTQHQLFGAGGVTSLHQVDQLVVLSSGLPEATALHQRSQAEQPGLRPQVGDHVDEPRIAAVGEQGDVEDPVCLDVVDQIAGLRRDHDVLGQLPQPGDVGHRDERDDVTHGGWLDQQPQLGDVVEILVRHLGHPKALVGQRDDQTLLDQVEHRLADRRR
jgi:hypothetical protein